MVKRWNEGCLSRREFGVAAFMVCAAWRAGAADARVDEVGREGFVRICIFNGETCTLRGYDKERVLETPGRDGMIGLQVHEGLKSWPKGTVCHWKNIWIKEL